MVERKVDKRALEELEKLDAINVVEDREWDSELAKSLCVRWCWGYVSAIDVQRDAGLAHRDELALLRRLKKPENHASKCLKSLAELGASGRKLGNCNRDLLQWLGEPVWPRPTMVDIMQKITKPRFNRDGVRECFARIAVPFLLPHIMFAHLFASGKETFLDKLLGKQNREDQLEQFWNELERRGDPRLDNHPMTRRPGWRRKAIPFAVHGDAVPVVAVGKAGTKSLDCVSFHSVLA